jgi:glycosyltransferase involved in cell wall biosynthesis
MPKITCILPAYNVAPYLGAAIDSILAQTERDFTLLILDDGSTDKTLTVAERFAHDRRVIVLQNQVNMGVAATANRGLLLAADSLYIARMDGDDIAFPRRFERQVAYLEAHPAIGLCGARRLDVYTDGTIKKGRLTTDPDRIHAALFWDMIVSQPTFLFRQSSLRASGELYDPNLRAAEDYDLLCRLARHFAFGNVPEPLLRYTVRNNSLSRAADSPANQVIESIRRRNLDGLLGGASEAEHRLNHQLRHALPIDATTGPVALADFLQRLLTENASRKIYPQTAFAHVLADKLLRLIKRQRARNLIPVYHSLCRDAGLSIPLAVRLRLAMQAV